MIDVNLSLNTKCRTGGDVTKRRVLLTCGDAENALSIDTDVAAFACVSIRGNVAIFSPSSDDQAIGRIKSNVATVSRLPCGAVPAVVDI